MTAPPETLIDTLYHARRDGTPARVDPAPADLDEALAVQLGVLQRFETTGEHLGGWKVGLTSGKARDRMGKDVRPFGYILQNRVFASAAALPVSPIQRCHIEPEMCLIVGSALRGQDVGREQAKAAVRAVTPAFEINEFRVQLEQGPLSLVADGLAQWGIVVGPEAPVRDGLLDTTVTFSHNGQVVETHTPETTIMDDPYLSLSRLCRHLHPFGLGLEPGQPVITGAYCHHAVTQPGSYQADFSGVGSVSVQFC